MQKNGIKKAKKKRFLRNAGAAVLSTVLVVAMLIGLLPGDATQAADTAIADESTADNWAKLNYDVDEGRTTKNDGRIWTDKSVFTGNASVLKDEKDSVEIKKSGNSDFLVGLSALSSTMAVEGVSEKPLDIIMVLDVSGSMEEDMGYGKVYAEDMTHQGTYYVQHNDNYYKLSYSYSSRSWYYTYNNRTVTVTPKTDENDTANTQVYKQVTKMEVLADSVKNFVNTTKETNKNAVSTDKQHRISIVKFSGNVSNKVGNTTYNDGGHTYNHSQIVQEFTTPNSDETAKTLNDAVDSLVPAGATRADYGMKVAEGLMSDVRSNAQSVVIFFTDGIPTTFSTWSDSVANDAIGSAKNMKDSGAWVYSVGVFKQSDLTSNSSLDEYMEAVSSNYPNATGFTTRTMGTRASDEYYSTAADADELKAIFARIAQEISGKSAELPTHVEEGYDADKGGYITFVDQLGDYMEVTSVNSVVYEGVEYGNKVADTAWEGAGSSTDVFVNDEDKVTNDLGEEVSIGSVEVYVTRSADARTGDTITVKVPAALVPLAYYNVSITDAGAVTERIPTTPIRAFYEVGIKDEVAGLLENPDADMTDYLSNHTDNEGKAIFYSNAYDENANAEIGSTVASFVPSKMNDMYYAVEDTLIFANAECTRPVTRINESATYYYQRVYYIESDTPIAPEYETVAFSASVLRNVEYGFNEDGQLYVKAGTGRYTRVDADDTEKAADANNTNTAIKAAAPRWENWNVPGSVVPVYLGNNGLLKKDIPGTLAISKDVVIPEWSDVTASDKEFSFSVALKNNKDEALKNTTFNAQLKDAEGKNIGNVFNVETDNEGYAEVTLKDGQTLYIYGLPEKATYVVKETSFIDGFKQTAPVDDVGQPVSAKGVIAAGKTNTVVFENTYSATGTLIGKENLIGNKILTGRDWRESDTFAFALAPENANNPMPAGAELIDGVYMSLETVSGDDDDKSFNFGDIVYTEPGTYLYDIREVIVAGTADRVMGVSYSQDVYEVTVEVTDNGDGTLTAVASMKNFNTNTAAESADFENTFVTDQVSFGIVGLKHLDDTVGTYELEDGDFTFELRALTEDAPMPEGTDSNGVYTTTNKGLSVSFGTIDCKLSQEAIINAGGSITHSYEVKEVKGDIPGMQYDGTAYTVNVTFTWDAVDGLLYKLTYPGTNRWVTFNNTYNPDDAEIHLEGLKYLNGRDWKADEKFNFVLEGLDGAPMPKEADGESVYEFSVARTDNKLNLGVFGLDIIYTQPGTYEYKLSEVAGNAGGMTYDDYVSNITVTVTDEGGVLKAVKKVETRAEVSTNEGVSGFLNTYDANMTYPGITVEKTLLGRDMLFGEFDFEIEAISKAALAKPMADTDAHFESGAHEDGATCTNGGKLSGLVFTLDDAGKEFVYKVSEELPNDDDALHTGVQLNGVTYDATNYWIIIVPVDNGDGTMSATTTIYTNENRAENSLVGEWSSKNTQSVPTVSFKNEYGFEDVTVDTGVNAYFTKVFEGREWLASDTFEFKLVEGKQSTQPTPMPAGAVNGVATVTVGKPASGNSAVVDFGSITFTKEGVYRYEITETTGNIAGVEYDKHTATLEVEVTDNGRGNLVAAVTVENGTFINTFSDEVTYGEVISLDVTKSLDGRELRERQFEFKVVPKDIPSMRKAGMTSLAGMTFRNGAPDENGVSHMFSPDNLVFTEADLGNIYTYDFSEIDGGVHGYTYDQNVYTLSFGVIYEDGKMKVITIVTDKEGNELADVVGYVGQEKKPVVTIAFENSYEADPTAESFEGTKGMTGRKLADGEFEFVLAYASDVAKKPISSVSNDAQGNVVFDEQTYTLESLEKLVEAGYATKASEDMTDIYTISYIAFEKAGDGDGITHTESSFAFTVTVTDNGEGKLESTVNYPEGELGFENTYESNPLPYVVKGLKVLDSTEGLTPDSIEGKYTFEITALTAGAPMPEKTTATNDAVGNVDFGTIEFVGTDLDDAEQDGKVRTKTFEYAVTETGSVPGVVNDSVPRKTFSITVTDNGEGVLSAVADPAEGPLFTFVNTYGVEKITESITGEGNLTITKKLNGRDMEEGEFNFELVEGQEVVAKGTNEADGTVTFDAITYRKPGTHTYVVREDEGNAGGVTYDSKTYQVTAVVTDNGKGKLEVEFTIADDVEAIEFTNEYVPAKTTITVAPGKMLHGRDLKDGEFKFQITAVTEEAPMPKDAIVRNNAKGEVNFGEITYEKAGTWEYQISEIEGEDKHITYDPTVYTMTVVVTDDLKGHLSTDVSYGGKDEAPLFVNTYKASPVEVEFKINKTLKGDSENEFAFQLYETESGFAVNPDSMIKEVKATSGEVVLGTVQFDKPDKYYYTIIEDTKAPAEGIVYDHTQHNYIVTVTDDFNGNLRAAVQHVNSETTVNGSTAVTAPTANFTNATFDEVTEKEVYLDDNTTTNIDGQKVDEGNILTYFINYTNYTGEDVVVDIEDKIPEYTSYIEGSASHDGVYAGGQVNWHLNVVKGGSVTVSFQVKVEETEVIVANTAVVRDGENTYTTNEVKNHTVENIVEKDVFSPSDLTVSIDGEKVYEGDELFYTVSYTNTSNDRVDIEITDEIPEYTTYVDKSADNNGVYENGKLVWEIKDVAPWATVTVGFKVKVNEGIKAATIENEATVVEGNNNYKTNEVTNYTVEDEVEKDVALAEKPNVSIDGKTVNAGDELLYTIEYKNTSKETASVNITDTIPQYTTYVEESVDNDGIYKDGVVSWNLEVPAGETITVSFKVKVNDVYAKTIENEATIVEGKNTYTTNEVTNTKTNDLEVFIAIQKLLETKEDIEYTLGGFEFQLSNVTDENNVVTYDKAVSDNEGNTGYILHFGDEDLNKVYKYELVEINQGVEGMVYDSTVHTLEIKVVVDENTGKLTALVTQDGTLVEDANVSFNNVYEGVESEPDDPKDPGKVVETGDSANIITYLFALLVSLVAAFVALIVRRRNYARR